MKEDVALDGSIVENHSSEDLMLFKDLKNKACHSLVVLH